SLSAIVPAAPVRGLVQLPVHCAASGGNLNILAWLVDDRCCPL
ncbi:unnamed protein product, partial [Ectocarpus sp. 13 AM-2016]